MTKTEKILCAAAAVFFALALLVLPKSRAARQAAPAFTLPAPTAEVTRQESGELWVTLSRRIDLNHADADELTALPGIGPVLAEAIVAYREENGPFRTLEELMRVPGIGESVYQGIRDADRAGG